jgi:hypothetical protein
MALHERRLDHRRDGRDDHHDRREDERIRGGQER